MLPKSRCASLPRFSDTGCSLCLYLRSDDAHPSDEALGPQTIRTAPITAAIPRRLCDTFSEGTVSRAT